MSSSKQENRFHDSADQQRRLFNATQGQDSNARMHQSAASSNQKKAQENMGPAQLLAEHMDASGNPVPDTTMDNKGKDYDVFQAMNAETEEFD
ncbi:hypothetical protein N7540_001354 [Penicillium herquei]|nr:hypothetical protein N7540_001354 [Penicillium herquei]